MKISKEALESIVKAKGYRWFAHGNLNLNIIGIRTPGTVVNKFDDFLSVTCKVDGAWVCQSWAGTTDPGLPWLKSPINKRKGCAALAPGQYDAYAIGMHRGSYEALCQRRGPVRVFRDNDRDEVIDYDPATIESGEFGINIHHALRVGKTATVDKHSAGCQVFQDINHFNAFMGINREARALYGNRFTYTLLESKDF